ncbi:MAG: hypothetical protein OFPI_44320 [Osedax symbiont Rs2]|nr:MAG: hypothetical protein OFPI_44320 [Osedax symbiont Rs2]
MHSAQMSEKGPKIIFFVALQAMLTAEIANLSPGRTGNCKV